MNEPIYKALRSALDQLSVAVFLLSAQKRVLFVNRTGKAMFELGWPVGCTNGYLHGINRVASAGLQRGMEFILADSAQEQPDTRNYEFYLGGSQEQKPSAIGCLRGLYCIDGADPVIALFIASTGCEGLCGISAFAESFGLSAAETRVLQQLVEVQTPAKAAARLSLSVYTIKSHMRKIFQKTGATRQVELLRLIECFRMPLRDARNTGKNGQNARET